MSFPRGVVAWIGMSLRGLATESSLLFFLDPVNKSWDNREKLRLFKNKLVRRLINCS
ncbi:MAG TPA: hypothetical protein LFV92_05335 [Rickettsia endosymbiont of Ceroptres masudai]|nr:hypothetical protein [Rickettsia endosymbiont of Ceroptres masudai]